LENILIEKVKNGNTGAFKKLYDNNVKPLYRFLMQFDNDKDIVEDWVQLTFIKAYKNISQFEYKSKFSTWLFRIGINEMKTDYRNPKKQKTISIDNFDCESSLIKEENFEWHIDMKWLLEELDENKKAIFILFEVEGYSHAEIAEILDISEAASRTSLSRTKQYLKKRWQKEMHIND
jgi:RNA polymerase sigma-70 factor (ECF subfamily)